MQCFKAFVLLMGAVILFAACAHKKVTDNQSFVLNIEVEHLDKLDSWRVTYRTSVPVHQLVFDSQRTRFRAKNWHPLTPGFKIAEKTHQEFIVNPDQSLFQEVAFEFESDDEFTPKDYAFFKIFSDRSLVMYTGYFNACPKEGTCENPVEFVFKGRKGEPIVLAGNAYTERASWIDRSKRGTYLYFGKLKPIETSAVTAVLDPALPAWVRLKLDDLLPRLFSFYSKKTHQSLNFKPFVFLNYSEFGEGSSFEGGTLPGLIQLSISGKKWKKQNRAPFLKFAEFLAHESAHLWNGQMFPYDSSDVWMHEGGADAFSYFAMKELQIIDGPEFLDLQSDALNSCLQILKNHHLLEPRKNDPEFKAYYHCGSIFALITHAAVKAANPSSDLFSFWGNLFSEVKASQKPYLDSLYFSILDRETKNAETSNFIRLVSNGPVPDLKKTFLEEFKRVNLSFSIADTHFTPLSNRQSGRAILKEIMKDDCGTVDLTADDDQISLGGLPTCRVFKKTLHVTHLNGHAIVSDGVRAYDSVKEVCGMAHTQVEVSTLDSKTSFFVRCPVGIPEREKDVVFTELPAF